MFKKIISITITCLLFLPAFSQQNNKPNIAPFKIEMADGKIFTYKELKKNTPAVLIYFSPTCEHCILFITGLLQHQKELMSKQIVMITYLPVNELKPFVSGLALDKFDNIKVGTEGYSFVVKKYYNVQKFPFVVLYDKEMHLKKILPYSENVDETVSQVLQLQ